MATKFPIQINNLRFFVNPTNLSITKGVNFGTLNTQSGTKYQVWYDTPEILTISGVSAGDTAYKELLFLKQNFELTNKLSEVFYKTRLYKGFITNISVEASTTHLNEFTYSLTFQLLQGEKFGFEDFSLKSNEKGVVATALAKLEGIINQPLSSLESSIGKLLQKF